MGTGTSIDTSTESSTESSAGISTGTSAHPQRIVIVGHGIAGLTAGDTLRREGFDGELIVVGQEPHNPYSRPALSKSMLAGMSASVTDSATDSTDVGTADFGAQYLAAPSDGAEVLAGRSATGLDPVARTVLLDDGGTLAYDGLVIASGARARRFTDSSDEYTLRGLEDARALRARLAGRPAVTVIGGGPLGMEVASAAREAGCEVTLVHRGQPMRRHVGDFLASMFTEAAREHGVRLVDAAVTGVHQSAQGAGLRIELGSGDSLTAEVLVSAIGDEANDEWLADSGLLTDGRLLVDDWGFVAEDIVAAGDVAWRRSDVGIQRRALWTDAIEQAKVAGAALLHGRATPPVAYTPYFWTEQFGLNVRICGEIPAEDVPVVADGDVAERRALLHWLDAPGGGAAASVNFRIPIPRLRRLARPVPVAA